MIRIIFLLSIGVSVVLIDVLSVKTLAKSRLNNKNNNNHNVEVNSVRLDTRKYNNNDRNDSGDGDNIGIGRIQSDYSESNENIIDSNDIILDNFNANHYIIDINHYNNNNNLPLNYLEANKNILDINNYNNLNDYDYYYIRPMMTAASTLLMILIRKLTIQTNPIAITASLTFIITLLFNKNNNNKYASAVFTGCLSGTALIANSNIVKITLLLVVTATVYEIFENYNILVGYGGRLGFCAMISNIIVQILYDNTNNMIINNFNYYKIIINDNTINSIINNIINNKNLMKLMKQLIIVTMSAVATALLSENKPYSLLQSSSIVTLLFGSIFGSNYYTLALLGSYFTISKYNKTNKVPIIITIIQSLVALLINNIICDTLLYGVAGRVGFAAVITIFLIKNCLSF